MHEIEIGLPSWPRHQPVSVRSRSLALYSADAVRIRLVQVSASLVEREEELAELASGSMRRSKDDAGAT